MLSQELMCDLAQPVVGSGALASGEEVEQEVEQEVTPLVP